MMLIVPFVVVSGAQFDHGKVIAAVGGGHHGDGAKQLRLGSFHVAVILVHEQVILQDDDDSVGWHSHLLANDPDAIDDRCPV